MVAVLSSMDTSKPTLNTWVEIVSVESLKPEVIEREGLKDFKGLVIKKIHKSNLTVSYEKMEGGLAGYLDKKLPNCPNLPIFLQKAREVFC